MTRPSFFAGLPSFDLIGRGLSSTISGYLSTGGTTGVTVLAGATVEVPGTGPDLSGDAVVRREG